MEPQILEMTTKTALLVLLLSLPAVGAAAVTGVLVSLLQAMTQIQEQTLAFALKLLAVMAALFLTVRWAGAELQAFAIMLFDSLPGLNR